MTELAHGRRERWAPDLRRLRPLATLADLLAPYRVVQATLVEQLVVPARLDDPATLQHVDPVGVHDRREAVRDEDRDAILVARDLAHRLRDLLLRQ